MARKSKKISRVLRSRAYMSAVALACIFLVATCAFYFLSLSRRTAPQADAMPSMPSISPLSPELVQQMREKPVGKIERISSKSLTLALEIGFAGNATTTDLIVNFDPDTTVEIMGRPKAANVYEAELAAYQKQVKAGETGIQSPFPSEKKFGTLRDLQVGEIVSIILKNPDAEMPTAEKITVAYVPEMPPMPKTK